MALSGSASSFTAGSQSMAAARQVSSGTLAFTRRTALSMSGGGDAEEEKEAPFTTWTYDKPCETMDWSPVHPAAMVVGSSAVEADMVLVGVYAAEEEDGKVELSSLSGILEDSSVDVLSGLLEDEGEKYKAGAGETTTVTRVVSDGKATKYVLIGLGKASEVEKAGVGSKIGSAIAKTCTGSKSVKTCAIVLPGASPSLSELSCAFYSSMYADNRFRTGDKVKIPAEDLAEVSVVLGESSDDADSALDDGKKIAAGIYLTKDIVNAPHNVLNSLSLADSARKLAEESDGLIETKILSKDECEERGMGAFLGVARGSETEPQFIHMTYKPKSGEVKQKLGVVGKGLLFDTGGYNIKTQMMELMKFDCGGSAAVFGAARAIAALAPEGVEVHFCVAACENMISSKAYVPSDILTASNGKTIEVLNTDAEGRLTLADALVYADEELGCDKIIELSTLTGACMISLGQSICGVWTKDDDLAKALSESSERTGDKSWRMPLPDEYNKQLESKIADIKNIGARYGGAITAALFLQNFVSKDKPFAHIDIAGPVWSDEIGATGFGAKLVTDWVVEEGKE